MEQYTGAAYVKDDPGWRQLTSTPGDPIGADETFTISGSYPDELTRSTTYTGGEVVYKYSDLGGAYVMFNDEQDARASFEKDGKTWDPKMWPMVPSGPDSAAAVRYVGTTHASVYFAFKFNYIQEDSRRAAILERALDWLGTATVTMDKDVALDQSSPNLPGALTLGNNYPNPFNPTTRIDVGIPASYTGRVALKVYNVRGQLVRTLFEGNRPPGFHTFEWDGMSAYGSPVSSGIYFARFQAGETVMTRKMVLLK